MKLVLALALLSSVAFAEHTEGHKTEAAKTEKAEAKHEEKSAEKSSDKKEDKKAAYKASKEECLKENKDLKGKELTKCIVSKNK